jgi:hypothetical protein
LDGESEKWLSAMVHGREQETESAARELQSCCSLGGPLPKLIAMGAALESLLMQWKLCSLNFDGQIFRKQQSICRVRWSSSVTCQQAENEVERELCFMFFCLCKTEPVAEYGELGEGVKKVSL